MGPVRRDALPAPGPPRARDVARPHAGGGRGRARRPGPPVVPGPAREPVPGRVEVPGRVPPPLRPPARARVPDEGRVHVRPGRGGDGGVLRRHAPGLPEGLRPVRAVVHRGRGRAGTDRRRREPRVHGARGRRRGPVRRVRERRLPGRLEGRDPTPARTRVRGRCRAAREGPHAGRGDDRRGLEAARRAGRTDAEDDAVRRGRRDRRGPAPGRPGGRGGQGRAAAVPGAGPSVRGRRLRGPRVREGLRRPAGSGGGRDDPRGSLGAWRRRLGDRRQRGRAPRHRRERPARLPRRSVRGRDRPARG